MTYRDPLFDSPSTSGAEGTGESPSQGITDQPAADAARQKGEEMADNVSSAYQQAAGQVSDKGQQLADSARQAGAQAQDKADAGMDRAASGLGQAADTLREQGQQRGGTVGNVAATTADKLDLASQYLRDKDTDQLLSDIESLVRRKPVESVLTAAGIGFVLSKLFR